MKLFDFILTLLIPALVLFHLLVTPYTKVEESFNIQATHDILKYGAPLNLRDAATHLRSTYDHFSFPGVVPRTFVGPIFLAGISSPIIAIAGWNHAQSVVRAVLGLFNAWTLHRYKKGIESAFGKDVGRWFILLMAGQFHVIFYASRTLPNMFAFGFCTLAFRELLPFSPGPNAGGKRRYELAIYFLVLAGVVFRSELAILLGTHIGFLLLQRQISLKQVIISGIKSALVALCLSVPIDSYFWQRPIWPELAGFYYNAIQGKSADWGTSPFHYYFTSSLPKLLLNPLISTILIPLSIYLPSFRRAALNLIIPPLAFVAIYSLQPHKEARFIIYVVPPLTCAASLAASYVFTRRSKNTIYQVFSLLLVLSIFASFCISTGMLFISSFNYPGGTALNRLHTLGPAPYLAPPVIVHMDVLSCMTGVTRFLEDQSYVYGKINAENDTKASIWNHSKEENPEILLNPDFWYQFDYVLTENLEKSIGDWESIDEIYGFAGIQISRPTDPPVDLIAEVYGLEWGVDRREDLDMDEGMRTLDRGKRLCQKAFTSKEFWYGFKLSNSERIAVYQIMKESMRERFTKGWWIGPRFEKKLDILQRAGSFYAGEGTEVGGYMDFYPHRRPGGFIQ